MHPLIKKKIFYRSTVYLIFPINLMNLITYILFYGEIR
jgi:hypothetical protein